MRLPTLAMVKTTALQLLLFPKLILFRVRRRRDLPSIERLKAVLIVDPEGGIGDAAMLTPLLWELRAQNPKVSVTLLLRSHACHVLEGSGLATEIHPIRLAKTRLGILGMAVGAAIRTWRRHFDVAIVTKWDTDYFDGPLIAALTRSRYVIGYSEKASGKDSYNWHYDNYLTHPIRVPGSLHEVMKRLKLLECFGGVARSGPLRLKGEPLPRDIEEEFAEGGNEEGPRPCVALGIGASVAIRRWPAERFVEIAKRLTAAGYRPMVSGGNEDRAAAQSIVAACGADNVVNLVGRVSIRGFYEALRHCICFVGNDSGPMHLAAAAEIPIVEISFFPHNGDLKSPTSVTRFGPWGVEATILRPDTPLAPCAEACKADGPHCITQITTDEVWRATREMLGRADARVRP